MKPQRIILLFLSTLIYHLCNGQIHLLDSCGRDSNPILNQYEIIILDSLFFPIYKTKKYVIDPKHGFDLKGKKIAFYSCTINSNTKGNGLISKQNFFALCRPDFRGHAGRGIVIFNEQEKVQSKGFDAVIVIDCPYSPLKRQDLIFKLLKKYD